MKKSKVLEIKHQGRHIVCIHINNPKEANPYRVYSIFWEDGRNHRKQIAKYGDFRSVLYFIWTLTER